MFKVGDRVKMDFTNLDENSVMDIRSSGINIHNKTNKIIGIEPCDNANGSDPICQKCPGHVRLEGMETFGCMGWSDKYDTDKLIISKDDGFEEHKQRMLSV